MAESPSLTPDWLTVDFLETILRELHQTKSVIVSDFDVQPAVGKGENYGSVLLRVRVKHALNGRNTETALIAKVKLTADFQAAAVIEEMNSFSIESDAYLVILPQVHALLRSIGDETVLAPK